jgi:NADPH:quinone reductase-like Zn-dependent oxidoreductase
LAKAVRFHETGCPDVLRLEDVAVPEPGPGEARIHHVAVGLNFADLHYRAGVFPTQLPSGIGVEASGVVEAVGPGVSHISPGQRVGYVGVPVGAYSTERVMPAGLLMKLPETIGFETAAAMMMRGLTAAYLMRRLHALAPGDTILVHAAAGGVGLILCQWAKLMGLKVIGAVSSECKAEIARTHGCDHVILYDREDIAARVRDLTGGAGVAVVYDSVGKDTFAASLASLRRRGLLVSFGMSSGRVPLDQLQLALQGSVFVTRPQLADYIADPAERQQLADELFDHVGSGRIKIEINRYYRLADAPQAHRDLAGRKTTGSSIFVV